MPTFTSAQPITAALELAVAAVHVAATDGQEVTVEVTPADPGRRNDVLAAERTRVEFAEGRLTVRTAQTWRRYSWTSDGGAIDVRIACPSGSALSVSGAMVSVRATGSYGLLQVATSLGEVSVDDARSVELAVSGVGDITVARVIRDAQVSTTSGAIRLTSIGGDVEVKNSNGHTWIGQVGGQARVKAGNGDIVIDAAAADVTAKTSNGLVHLGRVERGEIVAESGCGRVEVNVAPGLAAWLDLQTGYGQVHNYLDGSAPPAPGDPLVRVRARSAAGDLSIRRADPVPVPAEARP